MTKNKLLLLKLIAFLPFLTACNMVNTYPDADKYLIGNQTYEQDVEEININWLAGTITLTENEAINGVLVEEETNLENEQELVHSYFHDGVLMVKYFASGYHKPNLTNVRKDLTLTYRPGLSKLKINLTSGDLNADQITSETFDLSITSGSAVVYDLKSTNSKINLTSGTIEFSHIESDDFDVNMTSGTMTLGFIELSNSDIKVTSGNVTLTLPEEGATVYVDKVSGNVDASRQHTKTGNRYTFGSGSAIINIKLVSGNVNLS